MEDLEDTSVECSSCGRKIDPLAESVYYRENDSDEEKPYCESCALIPAKEAEEKKKPNFKIIMQSQFRCSPFEPFREIILTTKDLTIGNETYPIKDIAEAFNDFKGLSGTSHLGIRLKNGSEIKDMSIKSSMSNVGSNLNVLLLGDFSSMTTSMKNVIDKWVNAINTLILVKEASEE